MKNYFAKQQVALLMLLLCVFILHVNAQSRFDKTNAELAKIKSLKAKVEANPADLKAHEAFIWAFNPDNPSILDQYQSWMKKYPKEYAIPFAIGEALVNRENPHATPFLLQASVLKPNAAEVWNLLANDAILRNKVNDRKRYLEKAVFYAPKNPDYVFNYAYSFKDTDPEKYDSLSLDIARKFPDSEVGVKALSLLALNTSIPEEKIAYYKQIFTRKANHKSDWYVGAMEYYSDLLLKTNPGQAFELGTAIILDNNLFIDLWHERLVVADAFLKSRMLLNQGKPIEALTILNSVKLKNELLGRRIDAEEYLTTFKAEALDSAKLYKAAFDTLAVSYSNIPTETLQPLVYSYGRKLGMDSLAVSRNIAKTRGGFAKQAKDFSLKNYLDTAKTSLSDYKGKVVLLTYWFPGCGPCRGEFPHFEAVLKKFSKDNVAYLGLNVEPMQDDAVLPFLKESGYSFTPLHDSLARNKGNLNTEGQPTNYLIDQKGRIIFSNFRIDAENERTLELMIKETLAAKY